MKKHHQPQYVRIRISKLTKSMLWFLFPKNQCYQRWLFIYYFYIEQMKQQRNINQFPRLFNQQLQFVSQFSAYPSSHNKYHSNAHLSEHFPFIPLTSTFAHSKIIPIFSLFSLSSAPFPDKSISANSATNSHFRIKFYSPNAPEIPF